MTARQLLIFLTFLLLLGPKNSQAIDDELILLSPHWEGYRREIERAFSEHQGRAIAFRWLDVGGTSDIIRFVKAQQKEHPDSIGVDIMFGGGVDPFTELDGLDLFSPTTLPEPLLLKMPSEFDGVPLRSPRYTWYSAALSSFGLVYNPKLLTRLSLPIPTRWSDLARPEFFSWTTLADPRKSGSAHTIYETILQRIGWESGWKLLYAMTGNARGMLSGSFQAPQELALGEVVVAPLIDSYAMQAKRFLGDDTIAFEIPVDGITITGDGIARFKGAPHHALAEKFIEFVLGEEGQRLLLLPRGVEGGPHEFELGKHSILPHLYQGEHPHYAVSGNPYTLKSPIPYSSSKASARWALLNDLLGVFLIEQQEALQELQRFLAGHNDSLVNFVEAPYREEEEFHSLKKLTYPERAKQLTQFRTKAEELLKKIKLRIKEKYRDYSPTRGYFKRVTDALISLF
jgi:ABC-type Fe3+ transport system substrate-binding protein